jgi:Na+/H+-dicarboxylate symporter
MKKIALHWQILIAVILGLAFGLNAESFGLTDFTNDWIKPFGTIFMKMLKLIAVPLVLVSLVDGIANLKDISGLSRMGFKTIVLYLVTTVIAITIGLVLVNVIQPGEYLSAETKTELTNQFMKDASDKIATAETIKDAGPLKMLEDMVPDNLVLAMSDNKLMLQVIFFALLLGIAIVSLPSEKTKPVKDFFNSLNFIILKVVELIMIIAPIGVFALLASMNANMEMLSALGVYSLTVILGLAIMVLVVYPLFLMVFTKRKPKDFLKAIWPAQIMGFSTSSSAAALPVNMECCEKNLNLREETTSFVLPLGATINMDGTSLYQAVAAVFIAQVYGQDLSMAEQITIVISAVMASIGAAPVPGAGMVMLVIILQSTGINPAGLALIIGVDRILDMFRTTVNITSDACVATIVNDIEVKNDFKKENNVI